MLSYWMLIANELHIFRRCKIEWLKRSNADTPWKVKLAIIHNLTAAILSIQRSRTLHLYYENKEKGLTYFHELRTFSPIRIYQCMMVKFWNRIKYSVNVQNTKKRKKNRNRAVIKTTWFSTAGHFEVRGSSRHDFETRKREKNNTNSFIPRWNNCVDRAWNLIIRSMKKVFVCWRRIWNNVPAYYVARWRAINTQKLKKL